MVDFGEIPSPVNPNSKEIGARTRRSLVLRDTLCPALRSVISN